MSGQVLPRVGHAPPEGKWEVIFGGGGIAQP